MVRKIEIEGGGRCFREKDTKIVGTNSRFIANAGLI
jgi:hypothetical protein